MTLRPMHALPADAPALDAHAEGVVIMAADVLATLLLFAHKNGIDLDAALERKWFQYLGRSG